MNAILKHLTEEARKLTPEERIELVEEVLATLGSTNSENDRAWATEANDRYEAYKRGEVTARSLEKILAKHQPK